MRLLSGLILVGALLTSCNAQQTAATFASNIEGQNCAPDEAALAEEQQKLNKILTNQKLDLGGEKEQLTATIKVLDQKVKECKAKNIELAKTKPLKTQAPKVAAGIQVSKDVKATVGKTSTSPCAHHGPDFVLSADKKSCFKKGVKTPTCAEYYGAGWFEANGGCQYNPSQSVGGNYAQQGTDMNATCVKTYGAGWTYKNGYCHAPANVTQQQFQQHQNNYNSQYGNQGGTQQSGGNQNYQPCNYNGWPGYVANGYCYPLSQQ